MVKQKAKSRTRRPIFFPTWSERDRRDHAFRLLPFIGESNMPEWVKGDIERLLTDYLLGNRDTKGGRPRTPDRTHRDIARALAWVNAKHNDLRQKQRDDIVRDVLQVTARALTQVPAAHLNVAVSTLARWSRTPAGEGLAAALDAEAVRERARLRRGPR